MSNRPPNRNGAIMISNVLFALTFIAALVVGYLYFFDDRFFADGPEPPACDVNSSELACVVTALRDQDFDHVDYGRFTASADQLSPPGQVVQINDLSGFVFVYTGATHDEGVALREADGADLDAATLSITSRTSERPLNEGEDVFVVQHSNIIFILVGGTDDVHAKVQTAVESLP